MTNRLPLVLADDGLITQLQDGDSLYSPAALSQILIQNNSILKMLALLCLEQHVNIYTLANADVEELYSELI